MNRTLFLFALLSLPFFVQIYGEDQPPKDNVPSSVDSIEAPLTRETKEAEEINHSLVNNLYHYGISACITILALLQSKKCESSRFKSTSFSKIAAYSFGVPLAVGLAMHYVWNPSDKELQNTIHDFKSIVVKDYFGWNSPFALTEGAQGWLAGYMTAAHGASSDTPYQVLFEFGGCISTLVGSFSALQVYRDIAKLRKIQSSQHAKTSPVSGGTV